MKRFFAYFIGTLFILSTGNAFAICVPVTDGTCATAGQIEYDTGDNFHRYCNGTNWISMQGSGTDGACATAGQIEYDTGDGRYEYCDGSDWRPLGYGGYTQDTCATNKEILYDTTDNIFKSCNTTDYYDLSQKEAPTALATNLVAHWKLDEVATTTTAVDSGSSGKNGTLTNMAGTEWGDAIDANGLSFDGSNDYITASHDSSFNFDTNDDFTIAFWIKIPSAAQPLEGSTTSHGVLTKWDGASSAYPFVIRYVNPTGTLPGKIYALRYDGTNSPYSTSTTLFNDDTFHHVAFIKDGGTLRLYVDGTEEDNTPDTTTTSTTNSNSIRIARRAAAGKFLQAEMDDIRIYSQTLTAEEVKALFLDTSSNGHLVAHLKLNEASGTSAADASANTNTGTLTNMAGTEWDDAINGNGLTFDGSNDYINVTHDASFNFDTDDDFAITFWIKIPSAAQPLEGSTPVHGIFNKWNGVGGYPFEIRYANPTHGTQPGEIYALRYDGTNNPILETTSTFNDDTFHHVAFVKDGGTLRIYVDGTEEDNTPDTTTASTTNTRPMRIGDRHLGSHYLQAEMDDIRIYDRALTAAEIAALYSNSGCGE